MSNSKRDFTPALLRAFPELRRREIRIRFGDCDDALMRYDVEGRAFVISVDNTLRGAPRRVLEGGLAHELAHLARDCRIPPGRRDRMLAIYAASPWYRARDERATDRLAIDLGFGPQLYAFMRYARARGAKFRREHGMSLAEVARIQAGLNEVPPP